MFQTKFVEKIKTHTVCSKTLISKIMPFMEYCWEKWTRRSDHRWPYNTAHEHCMLDE